MIVYNPDDNLHQTPSIFINRDILSFDGSLKAVVMMPKKRKNWQASATISNGSKTEEFTVTVRNKGRFAYFFIPVNTLRVLRRSSRQTILLVEIKIDGAIHGTRLITVLSHAAYLKYLKELCGSRWDKPIYWDEATSDQITQLLISPPFHIFSGALRSLPIERDRLFDWLPLPLAGSFESTSDYPPFHLTINKSGEPMKLPHTDIVQLLWVLTMMGWIWTDMFFFATALTMHLSFNTQGNLNVSLKYKRALKQKDLIQFDRMNRSIYNFVRKLTAATMNHHFDWDKLLFEVRMEWKSAPSPMARAVGAH